MAARRAVLRVHDRIAMLGGAAIDSVSKFIMNVYLRHSADRVDFEVLRRDRKISLAVPDVERRQNPASLLDLADPGKDPVPQLGIVGIDPRPQVADLRSGQRTDSGVVVAATIIGHRAEDIGPQYGDIIQSLETCPVANIEDQRAALQRCKPGNPLALQVERDERTTFRIFEIE